jgi:hypothetical protein
MSGCAIGERVEDVETSPVALPVRRAVFFFRLSSWELALVLFAVTALGLAGGRYLRRRSDTLREPFGVLQGALLGLVALILAFGLSLAVGRYESRRAAVVDDANAVGTTYLRASPGRR